MTTNKFKILIAEDDKSLGLLLNDYLSGEGFEVIVAENGEDAFNIFNKSKIDICLLDVMMPKMDGFSLAKKIREINSHLPLIFISAKSLKEDKLTGYKSGADDYIVKPFDEEELLWKINALLRRKETNNVSGIISFGKYLFDPDNQSLKYENQIRRITEKENQILQYLFQHRNKLIRRDQMLIDLWGENDYFLGRSLDVFITKIRKYLQHDSQIRIENVYKVGFILHLN